jgi:isopentenyldiphosphate isomerase
MAEELYDVLDERGNKTGQVLPKSQVHERELWHASVFIWIYNLKGEVLIQKRSPDKRAFPDVWDVSAAGHMKAGEEPLEAAIREVNEEVGLEVTAEELGEPDFTSDVVPWSDGGKHPEFCWVYTLQKDFKLANLRMQEDELTALKTMSADELLDELEKQGHEKIYAARTDTVFKKPLLQIRNKLNH